MIREFMKGITKNRRDFIWNWVISAVLLLLSASFMTTSLILEELPNMWTVMPRITCFLISLALTMGGLFFFVIGVGVLSLGGGWW